MTTPLRVLFVEDSQDDVLLQLRELRRAGYDVHHDRVETPQALADALGRLDWDVIISDYAMPSFNGLDALRQVQATGRDIPFILVSGTIGEELAVECMKAGATDYLLKQNLTRLAPAVHRELRDAGERRQRRQAEHALRESQALLSLIYNHTQEMLVLFAAFADGAYRVVLVNQACLDFATRLLSVRPPRLGQTLDQLLADLSARPEESIRLRKGFADAIRQQRTSFELEWRRGETTLYTEQHLVPVTHPAETGQPKSVRHIVWASRDVTEQRQAEFQRLRMEAQLMHAQKLETLGTLASGIAHDFNNILAGLSGYVELLRADTIGLPQVQETVQQIWQGIQRATDLVRQILAFSRKRTAIRKPIHLGPVVHEALQFLRPLVPTRVVVEARLTAEGPLVFADPGQVHQVVLNLCSNALQAMEETGGRLTVSLDVIHLDEDFTREHESLQPGQYARLVVSDTGRGMDKETLERLFEPFFTTKPAGVGTGLGLAVVHGIVKNHRGAIVVTSQPEQGATFTLYLPLAESPALTSEVSRPGKGEHLLFVDDEDYLVKMGTALLGRLGYQVSPFTDPERAYAAFAAQPARFAALITDVTMPVMKGTELASRMRQIRPDLPVILTTGFLGPHELDRMRSQGFTCVLEKPYSVDKFIELLRQVLKR